LHLHQTRTSLAADSIGISPVGLLVWLIHLMKTQTYSGKAFPDPSWCVPGIIPEGCCILSGHPKIGKSFLVLAIALAAASGGSVLGVQVEARSALYMALEDNDRRLQLRSRILLHDEPLPVEFSYMTRDDTEHAAGLAKNGLRPIGLTSRWSSWTRSKRSASSVLSTPMPTRG
jgi:hypothetical protein